MNAFLLVIAAAAAIIFAFTAYEFIRNLRIKTIPANTPRVFHLHVHSFLKALEEKTPYDPAILDDSFLFINQRYDCSDFLVNTCIRILYAYEHQLPKELLDRLNRTILDFKYYMDQPGLDSMCYWSENHQILYAGIEYLAGCKFEKETFTNSGETGEYHKERGRMRILAWCKRRFAFGFTEWYSNNYYLEDVAALSNIQEFAPDQAVKDDAETALNLLLYDVATQSLRGSFVSTGGRMYENNKKSARTGCQLNRVIAKAFDMHLEDEVIPLNEELTILSRDMDYNFLYNKSYQTPPVLTLIARDTARKVIKASSSFDLSEGLAEGLFGTDDLALAAQWEMEAFSNHEVIRYSLAGIRRYHMFCSEFFAPFKMLNLLILRPFFGFLAKVLNPVTNGTVTQRANTYTLRTPHYMMATAQGYWPGGFSDQQHYFSCVLSDDVCVFHNHPSREITPHGALSKSPGYWVGNGRNPHSFQHENVNLSIYHLPQKRALFESTIMPFTHAYFPVKKFDDVRMSSRYAFGRLGGSFAALIAGSPLAIKNDEELVQTGNKQYWICECSSLETESFDMFVDRISNSEIAFDGETLIYHGNHKLRLTFGKSALVDGQAVDTQYKRFDSAYCMGQRRAGKYDIAFDGELLELKMDLNK